MDLRNVQSDAKLAVRMNKNVIHALLDFSERKLYLVNVKMGIMILKDLQKIVSSVLNNVNYGIFNFTIVILFI